MRTYHTLATLTTIQGVTLHGYLVSVVGKKEQKELEQRITNVLLTEADQASLTYLPVILMTTLRTDKDNSSIEVIEDWLSSNTEAGAKAKKTLDFDSKYKFIAWMMDERDNFNQTLMKLH